MKVIHEIKHSENIISHVLETKDVKIFGVKLFSYKKKVVLPEFEYAFDVTLIVNSNTTPGAMFRSNTGAMFTCISNRKLRCAQTRSKFPYERPIAFKCVSTPYKS